MTLFQQILVGVDATERSEPAMAAGLELAKRFQADIQLLHAVPVPSPLWPQVDSARLAAINAEALTAAWKQLCDPVRDVLDQHGYADHPVEDVLHVLPGQAAKVLLDRSVETRADLIVLGPHKKRMLFDFGSTARAVLAKVECSVWVQPRDYEPIRRILVPIDLSEDSMHALERACDLARVLGASVESLHCFAAPEFAYAQGLTYPVAEPTYVVDEAREATRKEYEETMSGFAWGDLDHQHHFQEGIPTQAILERQDSVDLIVMGTHGRTGLSAAVLGNVAYGVLKQADVPVMAIRHPDRKWLT